MILQRKKQLVGMLPSENFNSSTSLLQQQADMLRPPEMMNYLEREALELSGRSYRSGGGSVCQDFPGRAPGSEVCKDFLAGRCNRDNCRFVHDPSTSRIPEIATGEKRARYS